MTLREQVARGVSEWVDHALATHGRFNSHELADAIIGLLIPPGHVVVPEEPTTAMVSAGMVAAQMQSLDQPFLWSAAVKAAWKAMFSAAPKETT